MIPSLSFLTLVFEYSHFFGLVEYVNFVNLKILLSLLIFFLPTKILYMTYMCSNLCFTLFTLHLVCCSFFRYKVKSFENSFLFWRSFPFVFWYWGLHLLFLFLLTTCCGKKLYYYRIARWLWTPLSCSLLYMKCFQCFSAYFANKCDIINVWLLGLRHKSYDIIYQVN